MMNRKTWKERFEENYTAVFKAADNKKGYKAEYIYYAPWYIWDIPKRKLLFRKVGYFLISALGFALLILALAIPHPLNNSTWIVLSGSILICSYVLEARVLIQFLLAGYYATKMTYEDVSKIMKTVPIVRSVISASLFAVWIDAFARGEGGGLLPICAFLYGTISEFAIYKSYCAIPVRIEDNGKWVEYEE